MLRGYLLALALALTFTDLDHAGLTPEIDGELIYFLPVAGLLIWASVWLGQHSRDGQRGRRPAILALNAVVILAAFGMAAAQPSYDTVGYDGPTQPYVEDIYVYDADGHPLRDVQLFDQDGNPLVLPGTSAPRERADGSGLVDNVYPRDTNGARRRQMDGTLPGGPDAWVSSGPPATAPPLLRRSPAPPEPTTEPSTPATPTPEATPTR